MKKLIYILLALIMTVSFCACEMNSADTAISGTEFDPNDYAPETIERYEHRSYGIILEYPSSFEKVGNFELDGYMTFEKEEASIFIYVPDYDSDVKMSVEEYVKTVLKLPGEEGSGITRYGKSNGYKAITHTDDESRIDFIIRGVDAFYRFAYTSNAPEFTENDETFLQIMNSIRINDGVYNKLTSMASRYKALLDYATSMQYISDINYVNHSLNNFGTTGDERHKTIALDTCENVISEISEIVNYERGEDDLYDPEWEKVFEAAKIVLERCETIKAEITGGNMAEAQRIARTEIDYDLSDAANAYVSIITSEIAEY